MIDETHVERIERIRDRLDPDGEIESDDMGYLLATADDFERMEVKLEAAREALRRHFKASMKRSAEHDTLTRHLDIVTDAIDWIDACAGDEFERKKDEPYAHVDIDVLREVMDKCTTTRAKVRGA